MQTGSGYCECYIYFSDIVGTSSFYLKWSLKKSKREKERRGIHKWGAPHYTHYRVVLYLCTRRDRKSEKNSIKIFEKYSWICPWADHFPPFSLFIHNVICCYGGECDWWNEWGKKQEDRWKNHNASLLFVRIKAAAKKEAISLNGT
jgi:hypothetical protein